MDDRGGSAKGGGKVRRISIALGALFQVLCMQAAVSQTPGPTAQCVWVLGDSLAGGLAPRIEALAPGRRVIADGFGGQSPAAIAGRGGAQQVNVAIPDGRLSGSGATKLASVAPEILTNSSPNRPEASVPGRLQGVAGMLTWQRNGGYSFQPSALGQEVRVSNSARFLVDLTDREPCLLVIWAGRNGVTADVSKTLAGLTALADARRRRSAPFVILTVHNMPSEGRSTAAYENIKQLNAELSKRYPDNVIDVRQWLIERAMGSQGIEPNEKSKAELAEDAVPGQLLADGLHPNGETMRGIARYVVSEIERRKL